MEQAVELVSALRLDTVFLTGSIKHKRLITGKLNTSPSTRTIKKRKRPDSKLSAISEVEEQSPVQNEREPSVPVADRLVSDEIRQIEIEEIWDIEPGSIGQGAFGVVRFERRRPQMVNYTQTTQNQVRAVKEIKKSGTSEYMKELQAISIFSQPRYEHYFVQSYGWYENQESVFITMEYLRLGDLARFRNSDGPFHPTTAGLIVRQVLEGIVFMHEISFAHRDLKPGNILVVSTSPWRVKIADFGISKQCLEGTQLQTQIGTPVYMAPEQKGHFESIRGVSKYSLAVDIWAIGVITMELILKNPFSDCSIREQEDYIRGIKPLDFDDSSDLAFDISTTCRKFIEHLLSPNPMHRPTAEVAVSHAWFAEVALSLAKHDSIFAQDEVIPSQRHDATIESPMPLLSWSTFGNMRLTNSTQSTKGGRSTRSSRSAPATQSSRATTETETIVLGTYQGRCFDPALLASSFRGLSLNTTKYFVLRSDNERDMELCITQRRWTAMPDANKRLDNGYRRSGSNVLIFFSVVKSRKFCGIAKMTSPMDWTTTDPDWVPRPDGKEYQGRFTLDWVCLNDLSFDGIKDVPAHLGKGRRAVAVMDGQEICSESGYELLRAYSDEHRRSPCRIE